MIHHGDAIEVLKSMPDDSVQCCVTSPPYWGLRDYGHEGQIGLEKTPDEYVARIVEVFREVRRVLKPDGVLWLNLGDSYATGGGRVGDAPGGGKQGEAWRIRGTMTTPNRMPLPGLKPKDLVGIPWRTAFALQADGWWLRQDIIWHKPNPMPESVLDRCTKAHEYVFLMTKSERYYFDAKAISEPVVGNPEAPRNEWNSKDRSIPGQKPQKRTTRSGNKERKPASARGVPVDTDGKSAGGVAGSIPWEGTTRNKRSVWTITTKPFPEAHFATFPEELPRLCIMASSRPGDTILDPFAGAGTVGVVCEKTGRAFVGVDLNPAYIEMAERRISRVAPLFAMGAA